MKIYILADMEGISGIRRMEQVQRESPEYALGCQRMMDDINVAIEAAFQAGATGVVACDTHGGGGQVDIAKMDPRALYESPGPGAIMPALDGSFAGLVLLGHHAMAGTSNAFLDHTMKSSTWFEFRINGRAVGEIGIEAAYAGHFGVPVIAVSGDEATAVEARDLLGDVECAVVKTAVGRNRAACVSIQEAHRRIREAVSRGVGAAKQVKPWKPELPATLELTVYRSDMADVYTSTQAVLAGVERIGPRTLRARIERFSDIRIL